MLTESQLSAILTTATRMQAAGQQADASLIPYVCQALLQGLKIQDVGAWQVEPGGAVALWNGKSSDLRIADESLSQIAEGALQQFEFSSESDSGEETRLSLVCSSIIDDARVVVGFLHDKQQLIEDDLFQMAEILADIRRRELLRRLFSSHRNQRRLTSFLEEIHRATDETELLQLFVVDGTVVSEFDRISVAVRQVSGAWGVIAATGAETISPRAEAVNKIREIIVESERTGSTDGCVRPLSVTGTWQSAKFAVVFEKDLAATDRDLQLAGFLARQLAMALSHLKERSSSQRKKHPRLRSRSFFVSAMALALLVLLGAMSIFHAELKIHTLGQAVPSRRREIFSPESGVIQLVHVNDGDVIEQGEILFEIYNDDLYVLRERTQEELSTSQARLAALQTISQRNGAGASTLNSGLPTSVELAELGTKVESLKAQMELLNRQVDALKVRAPISGRVFRQRMQEELLGRPVQQGQYLIQVAELDGPWELQLRVPEADVRHVISAFEKGDEPLEFTFALETSPQSEHHGSIENLSSVTDLDAYGELSTLAVSRINRDEIPDVRLGAGVLAKIHCGSRSLMYLATRRLMDFGARYTPW